MMGEAGSILQELLGASEALKAWEGAVKFCAQALGLTLHLEPCGWHASPLTTS